MGTDPSIAKQAAQKQEESVDLHVRKTYREYKVDQEIVIMKMRDIEKHVKKKDRKR